MKSLGQWACIAVVAGMLASACNSGGGDTGVMVVVDGRGLTAEQLASVHLVQIFVDGDGTPARVTQTFGVMGLPTGLFQTVYRPHVAAGTLTITGELDDSFGLPVATSSTMVQVHSGNQVIATITFVYPDGGADAAPGDSVGLDLPGADLPAADGPVADVPVADVPAADAPGTDGTGVDAPVTDAPVADLPAADGPGVDLPPGCNMMACNAVAADGCCPSSCTAVTDVDCAGCGNGKVDPGEACDPLSSCPTACPQVACQTFALTNSGTCQAACTPTGAQTKCVNGDGCCPSSCTSLTDSDCKVTCGNGVVEATETCDGTCPTACPALGCQLRTLTGSGATCTAACTLTGALQTMCVAGDGCCPSGCTTLNDADCAVKCGNGVIESGEVCDGNCPTTCPAAGCQLKVLKGSAATCDATCVNGAQQGQCINKDGCCPMGCNSLNDSDCAVKCGNGILESGEVCDGNCPTSCPAVGCQLRTLKGSAATCDAVCVDGAKQMQCMSGDSCCPAGCNMVNDTDCGAMCGNGVVEKPAEVCDTGLKGSCPTTCPQQGCNLRTLVNGGTCTAACNANGTQKSCVDDDGCCPSTCSTLTDDDCGAPPNDTCAGAIDISAGGDFPFSLVKAIQDLVPGVDPTTGAQCPGATGAEVFFMLSLASATTGSTSTTAVNAIGPAAVALPTTRIYLDIYDPNGNPVNASIELYGAANGCPASGAVPAVCDATGGQKQCSTANPWPLITLAPASTTKAYVVVRVQNGLPGRYTLRYQRIPTLCISGGALAPATANGPSAQPSTCNTVDLYNPSCATTGAIVGGMNYYYLKCPAPILNVSTCGGRTATANTLVQIANGNVDYDATSMKCTVKPLDTQSVSCNDTSTCATPANGAVTGFGGGERGIFAITVDSISKCTDAIDVNLTLGR